MEIVGTWQGFLTNPSYQIAKPNYVRDGDLLIFVIGSDNHIVGWTELMADHYYFSSNIMGNWNVYWKVAEAEPDAWTFNFNTHGGAVALIVLRGQAAEDTFNAFALWQPGDPFFPPKVSVTVPNCLVWRVAFCGYWSGGFIWPEPTTEVWDTQDDLGGVSLGYGDNHSGSWELLLEPGLTEEREPTATGGGWMTWGACTFAVAPGIVPPRATIFEVYPHQAANTIDPNQRSQIGVNDSYIELGATQPLVDGLDLTGYQLFFPLQTFTASFLLPAGTRLYDRLVLWLDDIAPCQTLQPSGTVELRDAQGITVASLTYQRPGINQAWDGQSVPPTPGA